MSSNSRLTTAIHALCWLELSRRRGQPTLTSAGIADSLQSHPVLLRRALAPLRDAGILEVSGRGPGTGWRLVVAADRLALSDVHRAIGPTPTFGTHPHDPKQDCPIGYGIPDTLSRVYDEVDAAVEQALAGHTIAELLDRLLQERPLPTRAYERVPGAAREPARDGPETSMIRVLLAEDQHMIRAALSALLTLNSDIEVVAEVSTGADVVPSARRTSPDVAILDVGLPGVDGLEAASRLSREVPAVRVLIVTGLSNPAHLSQALAARVGGFLRKDAPPGELADAVRRVARGQRFLDPDLVASALEAGPNPLTAREVEVLRAAAEGGSTTDIGRALYLSPATVRNYLSNAIGKLGARNRLDAIRIARDSGWLEPSR